MDDVSLVRRLISEAEGTRLDFKQTHYPPGDAGNAELAKDLMSMANALPRGSAPAYILIGVEELADHTGKLLGATGHPNDSDLHQRVASWLSETPDFTFRVGNVEGVEFGVIEIRPGGRPFYPIKDRTEQVDNPAEPGKRSKKNVLLKHVALVRDGSSTAVASPRKILEWADEDDFFSRDAVAAEAEFHRAQIAVRPFLSGGTAGGSIAEVIVNNHGMSPFTIVSSTASWRTKGAPADTPDQDARTELVSKPLVSPQGQAGKIRVVVPAEAGVVLRLGVHVTVTCEGPSGRQATRDIRLSWE